MICLFQKFSRNLQLGCLACNFLAPRLVLFDIGIDYPFLLFSALACPAQVLRGNC